MSFFQLIITIRMIIALFIESGIVLEYFRQLLSFNPPNNLKMQIYIFFLFDR